jgi:hypothetical protein
VSRTKADIAERVRSILASKGFTLSQVSQKSKLLYGQSSSYFIPHNLYYDLRLGTFSPSIYQIFALCRISGYGLNDWLRVFGFDLEDISRLQVELPSNRTILLDSSLEDPNSRVPWFHSRTAVVPTPPTAPLAQLLEFSGLRRLRSISDIENQRFLYAKIGYHDAFAFPELLPGSIVRVNPRLTESLLSLPNDRTSSHLFLIEHGSALYCCRLRGLGNNRFMPVSTQRLYPQFELQLPHEARILGVVDVEIRSLVKVEQPEVPKRSAFGAGSTVQGGNLTHLLRAARMKMALSFREASEISRQIAGLLEDQQYFISPSSLSDYETRDDAPRHIQKVISLCVLYAVDLSTFLTTAGIALEQGGSESIPDHLIARRPLPIGSDDSESRTGKADHPEFLEELLAEYGEVPYFLRRSFAVLSGLAVPSLHDFFWIGGERNALHPYLTNGVFVVVNRRKKKPRCDASKPTWQQLLYLVRKRDGTYLSGCCGLEEGDLLIHRPSPQLSHPKRLRFPNDAEVVGQIMTIIRKLL